MKKLILIIGALGVAACSQGEDIYVAKVIGITDGDTLKVLKAGNEQVKIRLSGIDCPESHQAWGQLAKDAISDHIFGQNVSVQVVSQDRYGRTVATLFKDGQSVNRFLVGSGNCWVYPRYAKDQKLFELHEHAKSNRLGLWSMPDNQIVEPWNFRRK